eukprot:TRINITY_DN12437_c0_g1_i12.p1 TRINITY_DN12437_c0_g1~~TRINITY_DN12437_c0_g1_i12.p1  ORF type:complete len:327 (+),score=51.27 TRINITY_DN12437_c0_g1_i12:1125-2105(+)
MRPVDAASAVAWLIGHEEDHPDLQGDWYMFELFRDCLQHALRNEVFHGISYPVSMPLQGLSRLTKSEKNKTLIAQINLSDILDVLDPKIPLDRGNNSATQLAAVQTVTGVIFAAALTDEQRSRVRSILEHLKTDGKTDETKKEAGLGIFNLDRQKEEPVLVQAKKKPPGTGHVMLSYSWAHQKFMLMIKEWLEAEGFKVWMDVEQMQGSVLEAMAGAVEAADCIVVCMSPEYKESNACRTEGEYAYRLKKPVIPIKPVSYDPQVNRAICHASFRRQTFFAGLAGRSTWQQAVLRLQTDCVGPLRLQLSMTLRSIALWLAGGQTGSS